MRDRLVSIFRDCPELTYNPDRVAHQLNRRTLDSLNHLM